jgi:apolipoprotein N-acyltransferase
MRYPSLIALLAGAISAFAFAPTGWWPLMPLALAVLCELVWRSKTLRQSLAIGWAFGIGQFCVGLNWIQFAFTFQDKMPHWLGYVAVVLLSLYLAVYPALAAGLAWRFKGERPLALVLTLAGAWALTEWLRATMFTGFPWNPLGVVLDDTDLLHTAAYIGTYGLSALVAAAGGMLWLFTQRRWQAGGAVLAVIILLHFPPVPALAPAMGKQIRVVQPNIGQEEKWRPGLADEAFARLGRLSAGGAPPPRLLLWPEVAVPVPFEILGSDHRPLPVPLAAIPTALESVRPGDVLVTGAFALIADDSGRIAGETNSVFALDVMGRILGRYDKAHLVPYGEYLPMRPLLSRIGLSQLAPGEGDTAHGPGPQTIDVPNFGRMGVQICYEIIFSGEVVDRRNRPDFIFNPSNDAWFGRWGPPQHLAQARLRAAEEGIPVIRSTPTGISAVVDAHGRIVKSLLWRTPGIIDTTLPPPAAAPTLFGRYGNIIPLLLGFALLIGGIVLGVRRR